MKKSKVLLLSAALTAAAVGASCLLNVNYIQADASWTFNEKTDVIIDNIYNDDAKRVLSDTGVEDSKFSYIDVNVVDSKEPGEAIYKFSSELQKKDGSIRFELKADDAVDLSAIKFCTRGNPTDRWSTTKAPINETFNADGEQNNVVKNEWVTVDINIASTFSGDVYEGTEIDVTNEVAGFSLFNDKVDNAGKILVRKVAYVDGSNNETILDNFNRDYNEKPAGSWWWGTVGSLNNRSITLNNGSYTYKAGVLLKKKCAVLQMVGDFSGAEVATVNVDGVTSEYVKWANLKDHNGEALPFNAEALTNVDIDLAKSGLTGEFAGISIKSTSALTLRSFFVSDCKEKAVQYMYPNLDIAHGAWANDFEVKYEGNWPKEYAEAPEALRKHGIDFVAARMNSDGVKLDGKNLVLPAIPEDQEFGSFFFSAMNVKPMDYMVIVAKTTEGADMNSFRLINGTNEDALWLNNANAGYGLKTMPTGDKYPYVTEDGYTWYIVDLEENANLRKEKTNGEFSLFYSHKAGEILIDGIFFANRQQMNLVTTTNGSEETITDAYKYLGYAPKGSTTLEFTLTAKNGPANTHNLRIEQANGETKWVKDGALFDTDGNVIPEVTIKENETYTIKIDLLKSGFTNTEASHFHSHWYQFDEKTGGTITVSKSTWYHPGTYEEVISSEAKECVNNAAYNYLTGYDVTANKAANILRLKINSDAENAGALTGVRIEFKFKTGESKIKWFATWQAEKLLDSNGGEFGIALKEGENIFNIDLGKSGINAYDLTNIHIHGGDNYYIENPTTFTITSASFVKTDYDFPTMEETLPPADYEVPTVTITTDKENYVVNSEIKLTITPKDNVSTAENIQVKTTCIFGSGDEAEDITITDNKFTATKAGTYTVSVEVTDEAGNIHTETLMITVSATVTPDPENPDVDTETSTPDVNTDTTTPDTPDQPDNNGGLPTGAIVGITLGSLAAVAGIVAVIVAIIKKHKK